MSRCDFTDLEAATCAHCRPAPAASSPTPTMIRPWFTAPRPGTCAACRRPYPAGSQICLETPAGWRASCCSDA